MKRYKSHILLICFFGSISIDGFAQWKKIYTFSEDEIPCLYFLHEFGKPHIGFAGIFRKSIVKTTDGGNSWYTVKCPPDTQYGTYPPASSITFKNEMEGWFVSFYGGGSCYHTTDGGESWQILPEIFAYTSVYYNKQKSRLFASSDISLTNNSVRYSDNDGYNWNIVSNTNFSTLSISFSDDLHGCITPWSSREKYVVTSDGGDTWTRATNMDKESWQPVGIPNTQTLFALSERDMVDKIGGRLFRSDDGGVNWTQIYQYPKIENYIVTGTLQSGRDSTIILQTFEDGTEGIMTSEDGGYTWQSTCGPTGRLYTRFFAFDSIIYACDKDSNLWLNTTGIGSNSTPQLSRNNISLVSEFCNAKEDTLIFTLFDSCNGRQAELLEVNITGSSRFSVASGAIPRTIIENDTLRVIYTPDPNSALAESATLRIKLKLGWKVFDTVINLTGRNITPHLDITLTPVLKANNLEAGKEAECNIYSSNRIQDRGLDKITFDITYDDDLLEVASITTQSGMSATYTAPIVTSGIARLPITITGNNMTIDSLAPMVSVKFRTFLTDTTLSTIELSSIQLNDDEPNYKNCTLSATGNSTTFTQASVCGDSTIRAFIQTGKLIDILSINPNPTKSDVTVTFDLARSGSVNAEVLDVLGNVVKVETLEVKQGQTKYNISLTDVAEGVYYVRLRYGAETTTGKLIVE